MREDRSDRLSRPLALVRSNSCVVVLHRVEFLEQLVQHRLGEGFFFDVLEVDAGLASQEIVPVPSGCRL